MIEIAVINLTTCSTKHVIYMILYGQHSIITYISPQWSSIYMENSRKIKEIGTTNRNACNNYLKLKFPSAGDNNVYYYIDRKLTFRFKLF